MGFFFKAPEVCTLLALLCIATGMITYRTSTDNRLTRKKRIYFYACAKRLFICSGLFVAFGILSVLVLTIKEMF